MMTPEQIAAMRADADAGTPGPWDCHYGSDAVCQCKSVVGMHGGMGSIAVISVDNGLSITDGGNDAPDAMQAKANARRIARVPDMEATIFELLAEIERLKGHTDV